MTKVLGKGLGALIRNYNSNIESEHFNSELPIKNIIPNKNQPRKVFNLKKLNSLIDSIKEKGIIQPLTVRDIGNDTFEIIAGERRYRAAKQINLASVPAYILNIKNDFEMMELALIENIQRANLNAMEESEGYLFLKEKYNFSQADIAKKISKSRSEVANKLRLLKLPANIQASLKNREIEYGHARAILSLKNTSHMSSVHKKIIGKKLSVRNTEDMIKKINNPDTKTKTIKNQTIKKEEKLSNYLKSSVSVVTKKNGDGKIEINFHSKRNLTKIIKQILNEKKV
ncbi:MAG: chromosome partitioning protein ParB [Candidatus Marinimicrobia bacterium]|nr:chromosome partitioning protein ParB [Candidatus Neomarinimicrobiota bacterium]